MTVPLAAALAATALVGCRVQHVSPRLESGPDPVDCGVQEGAASASCGRPIPVPPPATDPTALESSSPVGLDVLVYLPTIRGLGEPVTIPLGATANDGQPDLGNIRLEVTDEGPAAAHLDVGVSRAASPAHLLGHVVLDIPPGEDDDPAFTRVTLRLTRPDGHGRRDLADEVALAIVARRHTAWISGAEPGDFGEARRQALTDAADAYASEPSWAPPGTSGG